MIRDKLLTERANAEPGKSADTEASYLLDCRECGVCPYCGSPFPETMRVGSGQKKGW